MWSDEIYFIDCAEDEKKQNKEICLLKNTTWCSKGSIRSRKRDSYSLNCQISIKGYEYKQVCIWKWLTLGCK